MATAAQLTANQANAQNSTGPRSAEGKARSSRNAAKHGLTSRDLVIAEGEHEEFQTLLDNLIAELRPEGELETLTFHSLVHAAWTLRRCRRAEAALAAAGPDPLDPFLDDTAARAQDRIVRYAARAERSYYRALKELQALQTNRVLFARYGDPAANAAVQNEPIPPLANLPVLRKTGWNPPDPVAQAMVLEMLEARRIAEAEDRALLHAALTGQPRPQGVK